MAMQQDDRRNSSEELQRRIKALEDKVVAVRFPAETDLSPVIIYSSNATANTEDSVEHSLKRVPTGFLVISQDKAGSVYTNYSGMTTWTNSKIFVKSSAASLTAKLLLF